MRHNGQRETGALGFETHLSFGSQRNRLAGDGRTRGNVPNRRVRSERRGDNSDGCVAKRLHKIFVVVDELNRFSSIHLMSGSGLSSML